MMGNGVCVDVTWDDPGEGGGYEHHGYFGLTDELIGRDHEWEPGDYPECTSLDNFYPKREGNIIVSDHSELIDAFEDICSDRKKTVDIYSISLDEDFVMYNIFKEWFDENNPTYKISSYSITYSGSTMTLNLTYFDSPSKGDVNGDSDVDMKDVTLVLKYLAEWEVEIDDTQSDVNGDGHIDMKDITLLLKYLAEWNVSI